MKITLHNALQRLAIAIGLLSVSLIIGCALGKPPVNKRGKIRVLIVGGGASHDFNKWYKEVDAETIRRTIYSTVVYTDNVDSIATYLKQTDVLYLATNQDIKSAAIHKAIFDFADAGHGLILGHPALWYNWLDWPEYNTQLVGGGAKAHDKYGSFLETVIDTKHPITKALARKVMVKDERYQYTHDPNGPDIEPLVFSSVTGSDKIYPSVFVVKHPKARIVGIALGHDAGSHSTAFYQILLRYSVIWASGK